MSKVPTMDELRALFADVAKQQKETAEYLRDFTESDKLHRAEARKQSALLEARLAESAAKTDAQLAKTDAQLAKTDAQLAKTDAQLAESAAKADTLFAKADAQAAKNEIQFAQTNAQLAKTDAKVEKMVASVDKLSKFYGGMSNNQGAVAEHFYYKSLEAKPELHGMHFERIHKNLKGYYQDIRGEYDIVLVNSKAVFIIEVKYKAHPNDLEKLLRIKAPHFPLLFNCYAGFEQHLGLACFQIDDELVESAMAQGVTILQRKGDIIETYKKN